MQSKAKPTKTKAPKATSTTAESFALLETKHRLDEQSLEQLAHYFGCVFEYSDKKAAVLIDFTSRIAGYVRDESFKPHNLENIIDRFALAMFHRTGAGENAAFKFKDVAPTRAAAVLAGTGAA